MIPCYLKKYYKTTFQSFHLIPPNSSFQTNKEITGIYLHIQVIAVEAVSHIASFNEAMWFLQQLLTVQVTGHNFRLAQLHP